MSFLIFFNNHGCNNKWWGGVISIPFWGKNIHVDEVNLDIN